MAQATWEKSHAAAEKLQRGQNASNRLKFTIGGLLILGAVVYLVVSGTLTGAYYYMTVDELLNKPDYVGQPVRMSGVVLGPTIQYDPETLTIEFTIANLPSEFDDLALALHEAANNPDATQLKIVVENQVKPDLLQHEAQAILEGRLGEDGVFYATDLLLKCPSRFEEAQPEHAIVQPET